MLLKGFSCARPILRPQQHEYARRLCYPTFQRGCRQVVRHKLPKLAFAGSSPVTRSNRFTTTSTYGWALCFSRDQGLEPMKWEAVKQTRQ